MRILLINDDDPDVTRNSVSSIVASLRAGYEATGHEVWLLTSHRDEKTGEIRRNGQTVSLPVSYRPSLRHWHVLGTPWLREMLAEEIGTIAPDIVHAHNLHQYLSYDVLAVARKKTPHVFLTAHDAMSFSFGRLNTERFLASNGNDTRLTFADCYRMAGLQYNPIRNPCIRHTLKRSTEGVIAVSGALKQALEQHGIPRVTVIHNGLDLNAVEPTDKEISAFKEKYDLTERKIILFGGRLSTDKGSTEILRALDRLRQEMPNVLLLVVGDAEKWSGLVAAANLSENLSPWYRTTGWLAPEEMRSAYAAADVVTTPSVCLDTFNLMNLEAMRARKPVVGTIFGGTPEIVEHGHTGFICNPRDTASYSGYLQEVLQNPELAERMGKAGEKRLEEHFSLQKQIDAYLGLFGAN